MIRSCVQLIGSIMMKKRLKSMHLEFGIKGSQLAAIGLHLKVVAKKHAINHATQVRPTNKIHSRNFLVAKTL